MRCPCNSESEGEETTDVTSDSESRLVEGGGGADLGMAPTCAESSAFSSFY